MKYTELKSIVVYIMFLNEHLDRVLEYCDRKYFGWHGTEKQAEVLVDGCVCTETERDINHSYKHENKNHIKVCEKIR